MIFHAGRQDVAILRRVWSTDVTNIFDTQISARFAGGSAQAGYGNLLGSVLGRRVGKTASYTRWDARPLTTEQLSYAAEDVAHLLELTDELAAPPAEPARLDWAREECRRLESATDERDPETAWERLPRVGQLDPRARAVARELAAWRERIASTEDRPVGSVLADPTLVEIAKRQPSNIRALEQIRGIHPSGIRRRGEQILEAVVRGRAGRADPRDGPAALRPRRRAADRARRGAAPRSRARGRSRLRADRLAQRPRADRRGRPPRRAGAERAHAGRLALSSWGPTCAIFSQDGALFRSAEPRLSLGRRQDESPDSSSMLIAEACENIVRESATAIVGRRLTNPRSTARRSSLAVA